MKEGLKGCWLLAFGILLYANGNSWAIDVFAFCNGQFKAKGQ